MRCNGDVDAGVIVAEAETVAAILYRFDSDILLH
jgi:hypothetical protein